MKNFKIGGISILLAAIFTSCAETDFDAIPRQQVDGRFIDYYLYH